MAPESSVGPYRIVRPLGHGGMGEVSLAFDGRLKRHVALKSLTGPAAPKSSRARLIYEARAAAALTHPGIAAIYDIVEEGDRAFMVMEYVEGRTLSSVMSERRLTCDESAAFMAQLCDAVESAHAQGVIHRDLKPGNIMVAKDGRLKILDFGLARQVESPTQTTQSGLGPATHGIIGTVGYIAPEQIRGTGIDQRCDIYGLGTIGFEMFTGRRPFTERDPLAYALTVTSQDAPRADAIDRRVGAGVAEVLSRALARLPDDRYRSASELAAGLQLALGKSGGAPVSVPRKFTWRPAVAVTASAIAAVAAIALAGVPWRSSATATIDQPASIAVLPAISIGGGRGDFEAEGLTSILASNLSAVRALDVRRGSEMALTASAPDVARIVKKLDATWGLQTTVKRDGANLTVDAALTRTSAGSAAWHESFTGDPLTAHRDLLNGLARGLERTGIVGKIASDERARLVAWPTQSGEAFLEYAEGRARLAAVSDPEGPGAAVRLFTAATIHDPNFALAYAGLSSAYWTLYQRTKNSALVDSATAAARKAIGLDPSQAEAQVSLSTMYLQTGRLDDALESADRAVALQPNSDSAHRTLGRILSQTGKVGEALVALNRAIALRPNDVAHHETKGFILYRAARYAEAVESYRRVTELAPNYSPGYQMLGTSLNQLGDTTQAIGNYEHAVRVGPSAQAYSNLAYTYYQVGRYDDALKAYQESLARDKTRPLGHRNLADTLMKLGRPTQARAAWVAAIVAGNALLAVNPTDAETIALVALCEAHLGRHEPAERHAAEAIALRPNNRDVAIRAAEVYAILRQPNRALASLSTAISLGYDPAVARKNEEMSSLRQLPEFITMTSANRGSTTQGER